MMFDKVHYFLLLSCIPNNQHEILHLILLIDIIKTVAFRDALPKINLQVFLGPVLRYAVCVSVFPIHSSGVKKALKSYIIFRFDKMTCIFYKKSDLRYSWDLRQVSL